MFENEALTLMEEWGKIKGMEISSHDFWFAINNTEVVLMPKSYIQTFGTTNLHYYMVSELMDTVNRIRVREGTIHSRRPEIIMPTLHAEELLEGFGAEARQYVEWLRNHSRDLFVLEYGFKIQKKDLNENIVSGNVKEVLETVKKSVLGKNDPFAGVLLGVDDPWDVCLLKLMFDIIRKSAPQNVSDMKKLRLFDDVNGLPKYVRDDIEKGFFDASRDPAKINHLMRLLRKHGVFEEYEDRFFALVKRSTK